MILPRQTKNEKPFQRFWKGLQVDAGLDPGSPTHVIAFGFELSADDVGCLEALRPLQQVKFDCLALIESAIAIFLDGGEVNENVFTRGPLDEAVSLGPVKPLYCTLLSHLNTPFSHSLKICSSSRRGLRLKIPPEGRSRLNQVISCCRNRSKVLLAHCPKLQAVSTKYYSGT